MLRLVKWAYDLGIKQERERIANALYAEVKNREMYGTTAMDVMRDPKNNMSDRSKKALERRRAVNEEVRAIVLSILEPKWEPTERISIMFPDDGKGK